MGILKLNRKITYTEPLFYIILLSIMTIWLSVWTIHSFYSNYSYTTKSVSTKAEVARIYSSHSGRNGGGSMYYTVRFKDQNGSDINTEVKKRFGWNTMNRELFSEQVIWYDPTHPTMVGWQKGNVFRAYWRAIFPSVLIGMLVTLIVHLYRKFYHDLEKDLHKKSSK